MANIIKLKYGSGQPANGSLKVAEVGLDLTHKIIYTSTNGSDIVEMAGGTVNWDNIVDVPDSIQIIIDGNIPEYVDLETLANQVKANADAIDALESWQKTVDTDLAKIKADILKNAGEIADNAEQIGKNVINISANADEIADLGGRVGQNESDIADLQDALNGDLTGLVLAGSYSAATNLITGVRSEAASAGFKEDTALNQYLGADYAGYYFIVDAPGTLANTGSPARADGEEALVGDWLVADATHWLLFHFATETTVWGTINGDIGNQDDLQAQFLTKMDVDAEIDGGTYA